jgi:hypothetical protein
MIDLLPTTACQTAGALRMALSMVWMLRRRARRHDARKLTA